MRRTARAEIDGGIGRHRDRGSADGEKKRKRGRERLHAQIERAKGFHRIRVPVAAPRARSEKNSVGPSDPEPMIRGRRRAVTTTDWLGIAASAMNASRARRRSIDTSECGRAGSNAGYRRATESAFVQLARYLRYPPMIVGE
jgi:hypothetical protein